MTPRSCEIANDAVVQKAAALPQEIREQARAAYEMFTANPRHPSLRFKKVHTTEPIVSVRVGRNYRAVGYIEERDTVVWFWIGPHEQYETLLANL